MQTTRRGDSAKELRLGGWLAIPDPLVVEVAGRAGFDWVGIDLQHGAWDLGTAFRGIQLLDMLGVPVLVRVADQVGFGFRRAFYFAHVVVAAYLAYAMALQAFDMGEPRWSDRLAVALTMYLVGIYIALTGVLIERLRNRTRSAVRAARELVQTLEQKTSALQAQAQELERARRGQAQQPSSLVEGHSWIRGCDSERASNRFGDEAGRSHIGCLGLVRAADDDPGLELDPGA